MKFKSNIFEIALLDLFCSEKLFVFSLFEEVDSVVL